MFAFLMVRSRSLVGRVHVASKWFVCFHLCFLCSGSAGEEEGASERGRGDGEGSEKDMSEVCEVAACQVSFGQTDELFVLALSTWYRDVVVNH